MTLGMLLGAVMLAGSAPAATPESPADASEQETYFETHVRPLLIKHCVECHGPDDQSGELRLDRRVAVEKGGGSGAVVIPGKPEQSSLIRAIGYSDLSMQMPPDGKLPDAAIEVLTNWVQTGAYWPQETESADATTPLSPAERIDEMRDSHWAYRAIQSTTPPPVNRSDWPQQPLDQFILAQLGNRSRAELKTWPGYAATWVDDGVGSSEGAGRLAKLASIASTKYAYAERL